MSDTMTTWCITPHAHGRIREMGLTTDEVLRAVANPELSYPGPKKYPPGRTIHVRGDIAVVVADADHCILTVLWHRKEGRYES